MYKHASGRELYANLTTYRTDSLKRDHPEWLLPYATAVTEDRVQNLFHHY